MCAFSYEANRIVFRFKWATYIEFVIKRYPLAQMGRLLGSGNVIIGIFSFLIYFFDYLTKNAFHDRYFYSNLILTLMEVTCLAFPIYLMVVRFKSKQGTADERKRLIN